MTASIERVIEPRPRDLGGFEVRRVLPAAGRNLVGPFIFFDQMGPVQMTPGAGLDVRPHPHINLATITYLFEGEILHRDSLGSEQPIRPGAVNWMRAGRGIVHSERTSPALKARGQRLFGMQTWVALPSAVEETDPVFMHHAEAEMPRIEDGHLSLRLIAGEMHGLRSPLATASETLYADIGLNTGGRFEIEPSHEERALYLLSGTVEIDGAHHEAGGCWCCARVRTSRSRSRATRA